MANRRALHFVFKIGDRHAAIQFYRDILGMKVLRHEEFQEGCAATCNGPYDGKWSKTMIGYGPEDNHFVCELTYNYGVSRYPMGNDFHGMYIKSSEAIQRAKSNNLSIKKDGSYSVVRSPDGYQFFISDEAQPLDKDPVEKVAISVSNLENSVNYWNKLANMDIVDKSQNSALLRFGPNDAALNLVGIDQSIDHGKAFGRIAFSCPSTELKGIEARMKEAGQKILTPYISLDTPGKATVQVVILADPDGHEICFVGDEGFRQLSQVDPKADQLLNDAMAQDKSKEWFAEKGGKSSA